MLRNGQLDRMNKTTHFCIEANSQVVNLQGVNFPPLQMCTKFQFRGAKKRHWILDYPIIIIRL